MASKSISKVLTHVCIIFFLTVLSVAITWPLAADISNNFSGYPGDGFVFLWNIWWFKYSLFDLHQNPFLCGHILVPAGANLAYHTFTISRNIQALPLLLITNLVAAHNFLFLSSLILAAWGVFIIVRYLGASILGSLYAGMAYSFSMYHLIRGYGHFNLTEIQWFPFYFLCLLKAVNEHKRRYAVYAGLLLLVIAYSDYYYLIFSVLLTFFFFVYRSRGIRKACRPEKAPYPKTRKTLLIFILLIISMITFRLFYGEILWDMGAFVFKLRELRNPCTILLVIIFIRWMLRYSNGIGVKKFKGYLDFHKRGIRRNTTVLIIIGVLFIIGFLPIFREMIRSYNEYRSSISSRLSAVNLYGANIQGYLAIKGFHEKYDTVFKRIWPYSDHFIKAGIEGRIFIGFSLIILSLSACFLARKKPLFPFFAASSFLFFWLSLGDSLRIGSLAIGAGLRATCFFPYLLFHEIPFCSGFRVPSRFSIMVIFCLAPLAAFGLDALGIKLKGLWNNKKNITGCMLPVLTIGLLIAEVWPVRFRVVNLKELNPSFYQKISKDSEQVSVLEIPLSWTSGKTIWGVNEYDVLYFQTIHQKPIFSGHSSRYPDSRFEILDQSPLIGTIMDIQMKNRLSIEDTCQEHQTANAFADKHRIRYIIVKKGSKLLPGEQYHLILEYIQSLFELDTLYEDTSFLVLKRIGPKKGVFDRVITGE